MLGSDFWTASKPRRTASFDRERLLLTVDGRSASLSGLPVRILERLIATQGKLVSRQQFKAELWPYAVRIDTERRLNTAMRALREALGDNADQPDFIETIRGRGYRWIGSLGEPATIREMFRPTLVAAMLLVMFGLAGPADRLSINSERVGSTGGK